MADIKKVLVLKKHTNPAIKVLVCYYKHLNTFLRKEVNKLVEYQLYNYKIILKEENSLDLNPYIKCLKINFKYYRST
jgi:hypothetical protein